MNTRDKIIFTARERFNALGYGAVTTAALARACGIAEGNLWYHFNTKRALLAAIAEEFSAVIARRLAMRPDRSDPVGSYCQMVAALMRELRDYRFLYRDQPQYGQHVEPIASHVAQWLEATINSMEAHFAVLVEAGLLDWPKERLRDLATNATILARYGLEHYAELGESKGAVRKTLLQQLTLFEDRLDPAARAQIRKAIEKIDESARLAA